uniref:Ig-like domain-containing protein n=1 Tax=Latimeria chalumnae TaxID=7897 RepID=H2ZZS3_LATCH
VPVLWVFLFALNSMQNVQSAIVLTQSGAEVKKPGESVKLSCTPSGYSYTSYNLYWIRQIPGKGLEYIGYQSTGSGSAGYHPSFQGRFTISEQVSLTTTYLQISSLRIEDTAMYYCARQSQINRNLF